MQRGILDVLLHGIRLLHIVVGDAEGEGSVGVLRVGNDALGRPEVGELADVPVIRRHLRRHVAVVLLDPPESLLRGHVAGHDNGDTIGCVVGAVILLHLLRGDGRDNILGTDGHEMGHTGTLRHLIQGTQGGAVGLRVALLELADNNAALVLDGRGLQRGTVGKVAHGREGKIHRLLIQLG